MYLHRRCFTQLPNVFLADFVFQSSFQTKGNVYQWIHVVNVNVSDQKKSEVQFRGPAGDILKF